MRPERGTAMTTPGAVTAIAIHVGCALGCGAPAAVSTSEPVTESHEVVDGRVPDGFGASVVTLTPRERSGTLRPDQPATMDQFGLAFAPDLLIASVGQPVRFRNSEDVIHNVRVAERASDAVQLNVTTTMDQVVDHTFAQAGDYTVRCDVHPGMHARIIVVSTPFHGASDSTGRFEIEDVPPGTYHLAFLDLADARRIESTIEVGAKQQEQP